MSTSNRVLASMLRSLAGLVVAVTLFACVPGDPASGETVVRMHLTQEPASLSLIGKTDLNTEIVAMRLTDALVQYDERAQLQPLLAERWEISEAERKVTFHLRKGVRWHDGEPVTSADVVFTIEKLRDPKTENRPWGPDLRRIVQLQAPDAHTVVATYSEMNPDVLSAWRAPILPEHVAGRDEDLFNGAFAAHPIGCGPFRFVSRVRGQHIVLEANDDYWGGRPEIDRLEIKIFSDQQTAYQALLTGELDIMVLSSNLFRQLEDSADAERFVFTRYKRYAAWIQGWNQRSPYFDNPRVRRAMVLALDRETFIEKVALGMGHLAATTFPPSSAWAAPDIEPYGYDPDAARYLLEQAGWIDTDGDGVRERDGVRFAFTLLVPQSSQQLVQWIAAWQKESWDAVGAEVAIEELEFQTLRTRRESGDFHVVGHSLHFTDPDMSGLYHSDEAQGGYNFWGNNDPEMDTLLDAVRTTFDPVARLAAMHQLQRLLHEREPVTALFFFDAPLVYDRRLQGVRTSPFGFANTIHGPREWRWASAERR